MSFILLILKSAVLDMVCQLFEDELHFLCGPRYDRKTECSRAGSDPGSIYVNGQRVLIKKTRVKKKGKEYSSLYPEKQYRTLFFNYLLSVI